MIECHLIVLEKSGNGFSARVAELPGCAVVAETREEALRLIREAIEMAQVNLDQESEQSQKFLLGQPSALDLGT